MCVYGTNTKKCLIRHLKRVHLNITKSSCEFCNSRFFNDDGLKMHIMRNHTGEKPFKCDECDYTCRTKYDLSSHLYRKHNYPIKQKRKSHYCLQCSGTFLTLSELKYHIASIHKEKSFNCPECELSFFLEPHLEAHIIETHRNVRPFPCPFCDYKAKRKYELKGHIRRRHDTSPTSLFL